MQRVDLLVISEPNEKLCSQPGWFIDRRLDDALRIKNKNLEVTELRKEEGYVCFATRGICVYATYISPNICQKKFLKRIDAVFHEAMKNPNNPIILGDIISKF